MTQKGRSRTALAVDGAMLTINAQGRCGQVDAYRLSSFVEERVGALVVKYYFDATGDGQQNAYHRAWSRHGFRVRVHPTIFRDGVIRKQLGVDVGLAVTTIRSQLRDRWKRLVLVAF